jgi:O-antigen/teichoic acid export membrane protein
MTQLLSVLRSALRGGHDAPLLGSLLLGISVKGVSTLATFAVAVLLARSLGPTGYGTYVFALTLVSLIALPLQSGLSNLVVREAAKLSLPRDIYLFKKLIDWAQSRSLMAFALAVLMSGALWLVFGQPKLSLPDTRPGVIAVGLSLIITIPFTAIIASAVRGLGFGNLGQVPDLVIRHFSVLALLTFVILIMPGMDGTKLTPMLVMTLHVLGSAFAFCGAVVFLRRATKRVTSEATVGVNASTLSVTDGAGPSAWRAASWALLSAAGLQLLNSSIDVLMLGWLLGDTEVGLYRILVQLSTLVAFGLMAINPVLHGRMARLFAMGDMAEMQRMVTRGALLCLVAAALPMLLLFAYGGPILSSLFGPDYATHNFALKITLLGQMANVAFGAVAALLNMTGHQSDTFRGMLVAVVLNLILNLTLIPSFGIAGAATATALSTALWNALLWHMVWRRLKIDSCILGVGWRRIFGNS